MKSGMSTSDRWPTTVCTPVLGTEVPHLDQHVLRCDTNACLLLMKHSPVMLPL